MTALHFTNTATLISTINLAATKRESNFQRRDVPRGVTRFQGPSIGKNKFRGRNETPLRTKGESVACAAAGASRIVDRIESRFDRDEQPEGGRGKYYTF